MKTPEGDFTGINREAEKPAWLGLSYVHTWGTDVSGYVSIKLLSLPTRPLLAGGYEGLPGRKLTLNKEEPENQMI